MSLWDSFTEAQASSAALTTEELQHMVRLSILQRTGQGPNVRYGVHVLVREAAADLLKAPERDSLRTDAKERFVHAMADVGNRAAAAEDVLAAREALLPELGNCRRFCAVPAALGQDTRVIEDLFSLYNILNKCGFYWEAGVVAQQVCGLHNMFDGTLY